MLRVVDPRSFPDSEGAGAERLSSLQGMRIGLLWNNRPKGDVCLKTVGKELERQFDTQVVFRNKLRVGIGAPEDMIDELTKTVDAVIVGVGD